MGKTKIEWATDSWNPVRARSTATGKVGWHCEHVTPGCEHCYAESINKRLGTGLPFKPGLKGGHVELFLDEKMLLAPLRWQRPRMIFVCSMTDLFADFVPDEWIDKLFAVMALCPQHTFQVLTKRSDRMRKYMLAWPHGAARFHSWALEAHKIDPTLPHGMPDGWVWKLQARLPLPNVWLGVSCEDQQRADERRDDLRRLAEQGWLTFVSYEPALGPVDWSGWEFLKWLISGGESGPKARPSHPDWHRAARDFCSPRSIAYFFKQWGEWLGGSWEDRGDAAFFAPADGQPSPDLSNHAAWNNRVHWFAFEDAPNGAGAIRVGKKAAGRLLDGREHNDMPRTPA